MVELYKVSINSDSYCLFQSYQNVTVLLLNMQIFVLESFPDSRLWWNKEDNVIPRSVAWSDHTKFHKSDFNRLFFSTPPKKLMPTPIENQSLWWRSSTEYFKLLETSNIQTPKPFARRKFAPKICRTSVSKNFKQSFVEQVKHEVKEEVMKQVKHEFCAPVEEETVEEEELNEDVDVQGTNGLSKSELLQKLADMQRELTNYKSISTRLTAIEQLLKPQRDPTMVQKAESMGLKIGERFTCGENSVIASNGVKGCGSCSNKFVDVPVGTDYVDNKPTGDRVRKNPDVLVDLSDSVNNHNLVDVSVSVSNALKEAYKGLHKQKDKNDLVDESIPGRKLETGDGVKKCVSVPLNGDDTDETNVPTDHRVPASQVVNCCY